MKVNFYPSQASYSPPEVDSTSSRNYVFLRKNIQQVEETDMHGETYIMYKYEEAKVPKLDYLQEENDNLKQQLQEQADAILELAAIVG